MDPDGSRDHPADQGDDTRVRPVPAMLPVASATPIVNQTTISTATETPLVPVELLDDTVDEAEAPPPSLPRKGLRNNHNGPTATATATATATTNQQVTATRERTSAAVAKHGLRQRPNQAHSNQAQTAVIVHDGADTPQATAATFAAGHNASSINNNMLDESESRLLVPNSSSSGGLWTSSMIHAKTEAVNDSPVTSPPQHGLGEQDTEAPNPPGTSLTLNTVTSTGRSTSNDSNKNQQDEDSISCQMPRRRCWILTTIVLVILAAAVAVAVTLVVSGGGNNQDGGAVEAMLGQQPSLTGSGTGTTPDVATSGTNPTTDPITAVPAPTKSSFLTSTNVTVQPTNDPADNPTTMIPSSSPSMEQAIHTATPTKQPSQKPTLDPTVQRTTKHPTPYPTTNPPSPSPTAQPTTRPPTIIAPPGTVEFFGRTYDVASTTGIDRWNYGLTGNIPTEIGLLTSLTGLWLYDNQLSGTIRNHSF